MYTKEKMVPLKILSQVKDISSSWPRRPIPLFPTHTEPLADFAAAFVQFTRSSVNLIQIQNYTERLHASVGSIFVVASMFPVKEPQYSL